MAKARAQQPPEPPRPLTPSPTHEFKRDLKHQAKRGKESAKLRAVIDTWCARAPLAARLRDHALKGAWKGWRECHVESDWLLIYKPSETELILGRTGAHADWFE